MTERSRFAIWSRTDCLGAGQKHARRKSRRRRQAFPYRKGRGSELQSRLALLSEMEREHEGYYNSVKSLLNLPDAKERGICGAVGQLLKVEETYETAIEAALGGALQNIVTETEEDARDAIGYLKRRNLGRATFLPVTAIKGRPLEGRQAILAEVGVIGTAYELVSFEEKFRQLAMYLLGRILVVENLDKAVQLAKKYRHQYKLVTLEGDILNPGGAMTGGSQQKKALHVFGRSRETAAYRRPCRRQTEPSQRCVTGLRLQMRICRRLSRKPLRKKWSCKGSW